jgi:hypothetical protein
MIIAKDGVTREQLVKLLNLSDAPECQFLFLVKVFEGGVVISKIFQNGSAISFQKVEERPYKEIDQERKRKFSVRFSIEIYVEERYWEKATDTDSKGGYVKSGKVPNTVIARVFQILNEET